MNRMDESDLATGAGAGIGRAVATPFAQEEAEFAAVDLESEAGKGTRWV